MSAVTPIRVDPTNRESAQAWDGVEGAFWAAHADQFDRSVGGYHGPLMAAAGIHPSDHVLDVGCGTGQTTRAAGSAASAGSALGVDLSGDMLEVARELADRDGLDNVRFLQADAQVHPFRSGGFDVVLSRMGTMFFGDADTGFANLARALRPGGRLAILVWQRPEANEWIGELTAALAAGRDLPTPDVGAPGPFAFADADGAGRVLASAGFIDLHVDGLTAPMWWGSDPHEAREFVLGLMGWLLHGLDARATARAHERLEATLAAHATDEGVEFASAAWLIRAHRVG